MLLNCVLAVARLGQPSSTAGSLALPLCVQRQHGPGARLAHRDAASVARQIAVLPVPTACSPLGCLFSPWLLATQRVFNP